MFKEKLKYALCWVIGYVNDNDNKDMDKGESMLKVATTHSCILFISSGLINQDDMATLDWLYKRNIFNTTILSSH